jgi:hypothetical protein
MLKVRLRFQQPWKTTKQHAEPAKTSVLLLGAVAALRRKWITARLHLIDNLTYTYHVMSVVDMPNNV